MSARKDAKALRITDDLTVYHAADLKPRLLEALAACRTLELDLSQVGQIDTAGLQLLLLIKREAAVTGKTLRIAAHSPAVCDAIDFTHLAGYFGDPLVISAARQRR
jgi:anti-sigma B factor antagonist